MDQPSDHAAADAERALSRLLTGAKVLIDGHTERCIAPTILRPPRREGPSDRMGSAYIVEKATSGQNNQYNIRSSGVAPEKMLRMTGLLGQAFGAEATFEAVDGAGEPVSLGSPTALDQAHYIIGRFSNGASMFWTAEFGNRINIHCPSDAIVEQLAQRFTSPATGRQM